LPLTAIQLLWINVITNGPPALALALDQNHDLMRRPPRDPRSPLLDAVSIRFIFIAGAVSALIGGMLLVTLPRYGYGVEVSRTLLFGYAIISQLVLAYSARRVVTAPQPNVVLHLTVLVCVGLQLLTVFVPGMRWILGIELIEPYSLAWGGAAVLLSWGAAEIYSRLALATSSRKGSDAAHTNSGWASLES
jgi:Ca2+-transporting ATPase